MTIVSSTSGVAYKHFILTRFWFSRGPSGANALNSDVNQWLENRFDLFKTYCLSSVVAQSCQDFHWLIYFDERAPADFLDKMRQAVSPYPNIEIVLGQEWYVPGQVEPYKSLPARKSKIIQDIRDRVAGETDWVLTTRFDSDDGMHKDFVKRLHDAIRGPTEEFLNFPNGIILYNNQSYLYTHLSNAFISLFERVDTLRAVICAPHEWLGQVLPVRQLPPNPSFLQVVHGTNDSNKPRGYRVHKFLALQGFEAIEPLFASPLDESNTEILLNNLVWGSVRSGRDQLVNQVKTARNFLLRRGYLGAR